MEDQHRQQFVLQNKNDDDFQRALPTFSPFMGWLSPSLRPGTIIATTISLDCVSSLL